MRLIDADTLRSELIRGHNLVGAKYVDLAPTINAVEVEWIPCSERLPDAKGEYLVTYHPCHWDFVESEIKVGIDMFRGKTTWAKNKYQRVIAWMPLPEPYGERSSE